MGVLIVLMSLKLLALTVPGFPGSTSVMSLHCAQ